MTAQIGDKYKYNGKNYTIITMSKKINFHPSDYGLKPRGILTSCWNGYWCEYSISEDGIFLEDLYVYDIEGNYPKINGKEPIKQEMMGHKHYKKIHLPISYTGKILVGDNFLREYYVHMGYQQFYAYEKLIEFVFEDGKLIKTNNYSEVAKIARELLENDDSETIDIYKYTDEETIKKYKGKIWWL